ncbi:uncharacterized protein [Aegilops tauschii subsp. strangulata]|uniref:uncharacterized protein n=1 Tax=Aegilops tauschii subsp. strangulata TaxID=200361 RepID=UPI003CC896F4
MCRAQPNIRRHLLRSWTSQGILNKLRLGYDVIVSHAKALNHALNCRTASELGNRLSAAFAKIYLENANRLQGVKRSNQDSHSPADISLCFREYISSSRHGGATLDQPYVAPLWSSLHVSAPATRSRWLTMSSRFMARRVPLAPLTTVCEHLHRFV